MAEFRRKDTTNRDDRTVVKTSRHFELEEDPAFWRDNNIQINLNVNPLVTALR